MPSLYSTFSVRILGVSSGDRAEASRLLAAGCASLSVAFPFSLSFFSSPFRKAILAARSLLYSEPKKTYERQGKVRRQAEEKDTFTRSNQNIEMCTVRDEIYKYMHNLFAPCLFLMKKAQDADG